jgi:hypothetical protein
MNNVYLINVILINVTMMILPAKFKIIIIKFAYILIQLVFHGT